jgi:hypothetical protein
MTLEDPSGAMHPTPHSLVTFRISSTTDIWTVEIRLSDGGIPTFNRLGNTLQVFMKDRDEAQRLLADVEFTVEDGSASPGSVHHAPTSPSDRARPTVNPEARRRPGPQDDAMHSSPAGSGEPTWDPNSSQEHKTPPACFVGDVAAPKPLPQAARTAAQLHQPTDDERAIDDIVRILQLHGVAAHAGENDSIIVPKRDVLRARSVIEWPEELPIPETFTPGVGYSRRAAVVFDNVGDRRVRRFRLSAPNGSIGPGSEIRLGEHVLRPDSGSTDAFSAELDDGECRALEAMIRDLRLGINWLQGQPTEPSMVHRVRRGPRRALATQGNISKPGTAAKPDLWAQNDLLRLRLGPGKDADMMTPAGIELSTMLLSTSHTHPETLEWTGRWDKTERATIHRLASSAGYAALFTLAPIWRRHPTGSLTAISALVTILIVSSVWAVARLLGI